MKSWYFWWVARSGWGEWFGPRELGDEELWRFEYDVERGTPNVRRMYRWVWDGQNWQYDTRSAQAMYVRAGEQRFASLEQQFVAMFP